MSGPVGRPIALPRPVQSARTGRSFPAITAAKEEPASPGSSRISRQRLARLDEALLPRDRELLAFVAEVKLASGRHLARLFFPEALTSQSAARSARRVLRRMTDLRLLEPLPRRVGGVRSGSDGLVFATGVVGRRLLALDGANVKRVTTPGDRHVRHTLALTGLVVTLQEADRRGDLELVERQCEPYCWRYYVGPHGTRQVIKPDLAVCIGVDAYLDYWYLELDLATESASTLQGKAQRYLAHFQSGAVQDELGVYPRVLWLAPNERRKHQIALALGRLPEVHCRLFAVALIDELVGRLTQGAEA